MDIGIIGRLGHAEASFRDLASAVGCDVFFHDRVIDGARPEALARFIDGCSIVVIVVDATPVTLVRASCAHMARRMRTPLLLLRAELGRFAGLMAPLAAHHEREREDDDLVESQPLLRTAAGGRR